MKEKICVWYQSLLINKISALFQIWRKLLSRKFSHFNDQTLHSLITVRSSKEVSESRIKSKMTNVKFDEEFCLSFPKLADSIFEKNDNQSLVNYQEDSKQGFGKSFERSKPKIIPHEKNSEHCWSSWWIQWNVKDCCKDATKVASK